MEELRELYQEVILDHGRHPRNFGRPDHASCEAHGSNPMCGDRLAVYLTLDDRGIIREAGFEGRGCAISMASASMMTEILKGKTREEAERLFRAFQDMVTGENGGLDEAADAETVERLQALSGVREFPVRVKCATLAWHTMYAAVEGRGDEDVTTEV